MRRPGRWRGRGGGEESDGGGGVKSGTTGRGNECELNAGSRGGAAG